MEGENKWISTFRKGVVFGMKEPLHVRP
jgi:hypothetical protein